MLSCIFPIYPLTFNGLLDGSGLYVNSQYQLFPSSSGLKCEETIFPGQLYKFGITRGEDGVVALFLHGGKCAGGSPLFSGGYELDASYVTFFKDEGDENTGGTLRQVRLWDRALTLQEMATECGCTLTEPAPKCPNHVVYNVPYFRTAYSSVWDNNAVGYWHGQGRLSSPQAWSSRWNSVGQWLQMDVGEVLSIAGVVTQGRRDYPQWVSSYKVQVSHEFVYSLV